MIITNKLFQILYFQNKFLIAEISVEFINNSNELIKMLGEIFYRNYEHINYKVMFFKTKLRISTIK